MALSHDVQAGLDEEAVTRVRPAPAERGGPRRGRDRSARADTPGAPAAPAEQPGEDDEDAPFTEPFSLLHSVVRERVAARPRTEPHLWAEVIHYRGRELCDLLRADPGQVVRVGLDDAPLLRMSRARPCASASPRGRVWWSRSASPGRWPGPSTTPTAAR